MKKILVLGLAMMLFICSCAKTPDKENMNGKYPNKADAGIWISYSEINAILQKGEPQNDIEDIITNCKQLNITDVYLHIRPFCDSLYPSIFYPLTEKAKGYDFDVFDLFLQELHKNGVKVHAWINPYRVTTAHTDINLLDINSAAKKWLSDETAENDDNVCIYNGIYLNPAKADVRKLILDGVKEVIEKYDVDGVHFDDYFYPTTDSEFDKTAFQKYKSETENPLSLEDWRRTNVNLLISECYSAIKEKSSDIEFSISPAADIYKNYNEFYADVEYWVESGYIDSIIPQLYFGFDYPDRKFRFDNLLKSWQMVVQRNENVDLKIGLATYKIGTQNSPDNTEWQNKDDIIARQAELCFKNSFVKGYVLFSYSSAVSEEELNLNQRKNLLKKSEALKEES